VALSFIEADGGMLVNPAHVRTIRVIGEVAFLQFDDDPEGDRELAAAWPLQMLALDETHRAPMTQATLGARWLWETDPSGGGGVVTPLAPLPPRLWEADCV
jgi:hypothetical protein